MYTVASGACHQRQAAGAFFMVAINHPSYSIAMSFTGLILQSLRILSP